MGGVNNATKLKSFDSSFPCKKKISGSFGRGKLALYRKLVLFEYKVDLSIRPNIHNKRIAILLVRETYQLPVELNKKLKMRALLLPIFVS